MRRSIPAWAGEPHTRLGLPLPPWVYPRVGGGTPSPRMYLAARRGLSPRGRGNPSATLAAAEVGRSIPAWAGEPVLARVRAMATGVYPRVGGGTHDMPLTTRPVTGLSPRGRGNLGHPLSLLTYARSIPAWAGEP